MPHPRSRSPRHSPGSRPRGHPARRSSRPRPAGFTPPGLSDLYRIALPWLAGPEKRAFFNTLSRWLVVWFAFGGTLLGLSWAGPLGAILGLAVAAKAGARFVARERFHRR